MCPKGYSGSKFRKRRSFVRLSQTAIAAFQRRIFGEVIEAEPKVACEAVEGFPKDSYLCLFGRHLFRGGPACFGGGPAR